MNFCERASITTATGIVQGTDESLPSSNKVKHLVIDPLSLFPQANTDKGSLTFCELSSSFCKMEGLERS